MSLLRNNCSLLNVLVREVIYNSLVVRAVSRERCSKSTLLLSVVEIWESLERCSEQPFILSIHSMKHTLKAGTVGSVCMVLKLSRPLVLI